MRILVATDGSRAGIAALKFGARLTRPGGQLIVLTVESNGETASGRAPVARKVLESAARRLSNGGHDTQFRLVHARRPDAIPEAIAREADRLRVDLVVVGSEGRDTLNEWVVGGTALRLIYVARRPVAVVRAPRRRCAG